MRQTYRASTEVACRTITFMPPIYRHASKTNDVTEFPVTCIVEHLTYLHMHTNSHVLLDKTIAFGSV
jgi:hypothetical protein